MANVPEPIKKILKI